MATTLTAAAVVAAGWEAVAQGAVNLRPSAPRAHGFTGVRVRSMQRMTCSYAGLPTSAALVCPGKSSCGNLKRSERSLRSRTRRSAIHVYAVASEAAVDNLSLLAWLKEQGAQQKVSLLREKTGLAPGCVSTTAIAKGEVIVSIPEQLTVTAGDASSHPVVGQYAQGRSDIVAIALWLVHERKNPPSAWQPWLSLLPDTPPSPLFWDSTRLEELLRGTSALEDIVARRSALEAEFSALSAAGASSALGFNLEEFTKAVATVAANSTYLPYADCVALVPLMNFVERSSTSDQTVDYDPDLRAVVLRANKSISTGEKVVANYGAERSNVDLFVTYGKIDMKNPADYIEYNTSLVRMDPLYNAKKSIVEASGYSESMSFPLRIDAFPSQLLSFLRLSRVTDPALFAKVTFERDVYLSELNEYEILMLLSGDCRERLGRFPKSLDDDLRQLQRNDITEEEREAVRARIAEQRILLATVDAARQRLAPIRGIPTKSGKMVNPNQDIIDMFDNAEQMLSAPLKLVADLFSGRDAGKK